MLAMEKYLAAHNGLPSSEHVILELIRQIDNAEVALETLVHQIGNDTALSAKLLKLANSSFFGMSSKIGSIQSAVLVLGLANVKKLAISVAFLNTGNHSPALVDFWRHNLQIAYCADWLASKTGHPQDICFVAGLLHDVGILLLYGNSPEQHPQLIHTQQAGLDLIVQEIETEGFDHTELGAMLATQWHFPDTIIQAIRCHHQSQKALTLPVAAIVYCADQLVNFHKAVRLEGQNDIQSLIPADIARYLGLTEEILPEWTIELDTLISGVDGISLE